LGITQLRAGNYPHANQHFNQLLAPAGNFTTEARYYLGLSLLSSGDTPAGLTELRKITAADGRNIYQKAQALVGASW
jgi:hypothetical protein